MRAVTSLLASREADLEVILVDQSDDDRTQVAMAALSADPRLRYVRSATRGKGAAMNEGLRLARNELIVCTDDDCEVPADWAAGMLEILDRRPATALVFSSVVAPPDERRPGYVPTFLPPRDRSIRRVVGARGAKGLGAGMAVRRSCIAVIGGMDELMGPGGRFPSCDDWDLELRVLEHGWEVFEACALRTVHYGYRDMAQGREHIRRDWSAIGALYAKHIKALRTSAVVIACWDLWTLAVLPMAHDMARGRRPRGAQKIIGFTRGFAAGMKTPVDRRTVRFRRA